MKRFLVLVMALVLLFTGTEYALADNETASANTRDGGELVIMLDPGHDATHGGAVGGGVIEQQAVLKIGLYLRDELNKYENVKVYMTREGMDCAFPNTIGVPEGSKRCNEARVAYADSVEADVFIALHLNSYTNSTPNGAIVYVQNNNFSPEAGKISQELGQCIVNRLAELGLKNGGIFQKGSAADTRPEEYYYEDGSIADYYRVLRYSKKVHMPAMIIEHAFLSNPSDVALVLSSEDGLKALALKDAQGIVDYYGLTLKEGCVAGELPDIQQVPETQTKPSPEPEPQPEPESTPEPETEIETQIPEETETEMIPEETEKVEEPTEEDTTADDLDASSEPKEFPWGGIVMLVVMFIAGGIGGAVGVRYYLKKQSAMHKKDEE
ncbi:MAG: N-acetylmuramoyl-L-alanine amidase [Agathobacter sp.]|nr:N-acetylmuramoyl-L-alanine amidase [Agathobacter sp.]